MRTRLMLAVAAAVAIVIGSAGAALATEPVSLDASRVLDQADVLSDSQQASVNDRLRALSPTSGVDLWVVYVSTFTNPTDPEEWANATAEANGLGPNQYLLAISTEGRQLYLSGYSQGPVSPEQLTRIEQERIRPALSESDWSGAAVAAADGLANAVGGGTGGSGDSGASGGGFAGALMPILLVVVLAALAALVLWIVVRSRRKGGPARAPLPTDAAQAPQDPLAQVPTAELAQRAASALIDTDDAIKTSGQELDFARAQFGDAAAADFAQALAQAKEKLDQAFGLKQQLDDATPDTEGDVRSWNAQILDQCAQANAGLDEKAQAFDELRQLEQTAPEALARVQTLRATVGADTEGAARTLATLQQSYAPAALATIVGNPAQAAQVLGFADERLTAAQQSVASGDKSSAAVDIRAAEDAVGQADLLQKAIGKLGADLAQGETDAAGLVAELDQDVAVASGMPDPDGRLAAVIGAIRGQADAAKALLSGPAKAPLAALDALGKANAQIDATLAGIRDTQVQAQRAAQQLGALLTQAQAQVSTAEDFITSRRGAIGVEARTRLAEAGAALVQARQLQQSDPAQALASAQRANDLAAQALQSAQNDVGAFSGGGMFGGGTLGGSNTSGGNMMGAILGGIVINSLLGGGGGGGVFGGGRSSGGGGIVAGSFGGGGTRSRRGGGRF